MITQDTQPRLDLQACPLCGQEQDIIFNGHVPTGNPDNPQEVRVEKDKGYSFCNCRNIHFTDWKNIEQGVYDEAYEKKYDNENMKRLSLRCASEYFGIVKHLTQGVKFLEIGAVAPFLLDEAKRQGFETFALDIISHKFQGHQNIAANFEDWDPDFQELVSKKGGLVDVVWASHIFEHFKDPIVAARKAFNILAPGGVLFVAMPDPWFIDFRAPLLWGHWHLKEHHIFWDRDSFCRMMEEIGFKTILKKRNVTYDFICIGDYHLIFQKP